MAGERAQTAWMAAPGAVPPRRWRPSRIAYWVAFGLLCAALAGLIVGFRVMTGVVRMPPGTASMEPGIQPGDLLNYQRGAGGIVRGDVVLLQLPGGLVVKRVIGLPGDHVECCDAAGQVTVDGHGLAEGYLPAGYAPAPWERFRVTVGAGQVWVMGDNRAVSMDSRQRGPLPEGDIVGRVVTLLRSGGHIDLTTPPAFTMAGLAPPDHRVHLPLLLLGGAVLVFVAVLVQGITGIIVWAVRRRRGRRLRYGG
jgi:signal peptidase I